MFLSLDIPENVIAAAERHEHEVDEQHSHSIQKMRGNPVCGQPS
jgi:hypothetical protein